MAEPNETDNKEDKIFSAHQATATISLESTNNRHQISAAPVTDSWQTSQLIFNLQHERQNTRQAEQFATNLKSLTDLKSPTDSRDDKNN